MADFNDDIIAKAGVDLSNATSITAPQIAGGPYIVSAFTQTVLFSDLGSGASDAIALSSFPTNVLLIGAALEINTAFAGEADLAVKVGDTANDDELIASFNLNAVSAGWAAITAGAATLPQFEADYGTAGGDITFTATELDDVTAGSLTLHIFYVDLVLAT